MILRFVLTVALGVGALACKRDNTPPAAGSFECSADADCQLSCVPRKGCCEACDCSFVYHRDELVKVREAYQRRCEGNFCQRSCPAPTAEWLPICQDGRCAAKVVK